MVALSDLIAHVVGYHPKGYLVVLHNYSWVVVLKLCYPADGDDKGNGRRKCRKRKGSVQFSVGNLPVVLMLWIGHF